MITIQITLGGTSNISGGQLMSEPPYETPHRNKQYDVGG